MLFYYIFPTFYLFTNIFFIYRYYIYLLAFYLHNNLCLPASRGTAGLYRSNVNNEIIDPVLFVSLVRFFFMYLRITLRLCIMQTWRYHFNGSNSVCRLIICLYIYVLIIDVVPQAACTLHVIRDFISFWPSPFAANEDVLLQYSYNPLGVL